MKTPFDMAKQAATRALGTSFFADRGDRNAALSKLTEEAEEIRAARTPGELEGEIGDALFVLVRLSVQEGVDPEDALRRAALRFERRITEATQLLELGGADASSATLAEWELAWRTAKRLEASPRQGGERWEVLAHTSPSGKRLFRCSCCGRESVAPDKWCPPGCSSQRGG